MRGINYNKPLIKQKTKEALLGYLFIVPSISGFLLFYLWPYVISFYYSFTEGITANFVGLKNYIDLFQSDPYRLALRNTTVFMAIGIPLIIIVSFVVALLIKSVKNLSIIVIIPLIIPAASVIAFFKIIFAHNGTVNRLISFFGIQQIDFMDSGWAIVVLVIIFVWKYFGYNAILFLTALNSIPNQQYENARLDGANKFQILIHITIPFCIPINFFVFIMSFINSFKIFREVLLLYGIYPNENVYMLQHFMNNNFFNLSYQRLSTAAFVMTSLIVALVFVCFKWQKKVQGKLQMD